MFIWNSGVILPATYKRWNVKRNENVVSYNYVAMVVIGNDGVRVVEYTGVERRQVILMSFLFSHEWKVQAEERWNYEAGQEDEQTDGDLWGVRPKELVQNRLRSDCRIWEKLSLDDEIEKNMMKRTLNPGGWIVNSLRM